MGSFTIIYLLLTGVLSVQAFDVSGVRVFLTEVLQLSNYHVVTFCFCEKTSNEFLEMVKVPLELGQTVELFDLNDNWTINEIDEFKNFHRKVVVDLDCPHGRGQKVMQKASDKWAVNESMHFFLFGSDFNETIEYVKTQDVQINSKLKLIISNENINEYDVFDVHSPGLYRTKKIYFNWIGSCSLQPVGGDRYHHCNITPPKLNYDLEGSHLDAAFVLPKTPPGKIALQFAMTITPHDFNYNFIRSVSQVVKLFAEYYNFRLHWVRVNNWGYVRDDNVTFNGAVGMMQRHELNLSSATMIWRPLQIRHMDSGLGSPQLVRQSFVFRHPHSGRGVSSMQNAFLRPLSQGVWISVAVTSTICFITFVLVLRHEQQTFSIDGISQTALTIVGILAQQGFTDIARSVHFKLAVLTFLILSFFLLQFYSGSIVGTLLTPFPKSIKTIEALTDSDLKVILENVPSAGQILKVYATELHQKKILDANASSHSIPEGLKIVKKGGYAFFVYIDQARELIKRNFTSDEIDDLQEVYYVDNSHLAITYYPVRKFAPCRELIRVANKKVVEVGLADYWNTQYISSRPFGSDNQLRIVNISLSQVSTLLYLLLFGFVVSGVIFLIEVVMVVRKGKLLRGKKIRI